MGSIIIALLSRMSIGSCMMTRLLRYPDITTAWSKLYSVLSILPTKKNLVCAGYWWLGWCDHYVWERSFTTSSALLWSCKLIFFKVQGCCAVAWLTCVMRYRVFSWWLKSRDRNTKIRFELMGDDNVGMIQQLHWHVGFVEPRLKINGRLSI
jgi:hypothetical protein